MTRLLLPPIIALLLPAPQAQAQTVTQICAANAVPANVMRSRFHDTDWRGQRYASAWQSMAVHQRNCVRLQDVTDVVVEFDRYDISFQWKDACSQPVETRGRDSEVVAYTVGMTDLPQCAVR